MQVKELTAGTRVTATTGRYAGRIGTVNGVDAGTVTEPGHANYGRAYIGVNWDAIDGDMGCDRRSRPFADELAEAEPTWQGANFADFVVGDRIRFQTIDNGFGGSGDFIVREGTVTAVTPRTLRVDCDWHWLGNRAVIRRADWHRRDPHKSA